MYTEREVTASSKSLTRDEEVDVLGRDQRWVRRPLPGAVEGAVDSGDELVRGSGVNGTRTPTSAGSVHARSVLVRELAEAELPGSGEVRGQPFHCDDFDVVQQT